MFQKYRKFISLLTVLAIVFTLGGVAYLVDMHVTNASVAADFDVATHAAPTATFNSGTTNKVIMGVILPTPNTDTSLAGTAPSAGTAVTGTNPWSGATPPVRFFDGGTAGIWEAGSDLIATDDDSSGTWTLAGDTLLAGTAPVDGTVITGTNPWSGATVPVVFNDAGTAGTWEAGSDFIMTDDDASGYYRGDELTSVTVSNAGTAVDADISAIKIWEDGASAGFDGDETEVGSDSATPYWDQTITTASASVYTSTSNNERIFITVNVASSPTDNNTIQAELGTNSVALASNNDGPTDSALTNANIQTLNVVSSTPPDTTPPVGAAITINSDAESTTVRDVKLQLSATGASWYEVSEDSLFTDANQVRFFEPSMEVDFTLSAGEGTKRVYARYMDDAGNFSGNVSDTIVLGTVVEEEPPAPMFADGDLVREAGSNDVYIVKLAGDKKFKRLILNPAIFDSYGHLEWSNVQDVAAGTLAAYTLSDMILEDGGTKVYKVSSAASADTGTKQWLNMSAAAFEACGYDWDSLYMVNSTEVSDSFYPVGVDVTSC